MVATKANKSTKQYQQKHFLYSFNPSENKINSTQLIRSVKTKTEN